MLANLLSLAGLDGVITVQLGCPQKGSSARQGLGNVSVRQADGRVVPLVLQPGGNDTCREVRVVVPNGLTSDSLAQKIRAAIDSKGKNKEEVPVNLLQEQQRVQAELAVAEAALHETEGQLAAFDQEAQALDERERVITNRMEQIEAEKQRLRTEFEAALAALDPLVAVIEGEKRIVIRDRETFGQRRAPIQGERLQREEARDWLRMELDDITDRRKQQARKAAEQLAAIHGFSLEELVVPADAKQS